MCVLIMNWFLPSAEVGLLYACYYPLYMAPKKGNSSDLLLFHTHDPVGSADYLHNYNPKALMWLLLSSFTRSPERGNLHICFHSTSCPHTVRSIRPTTSV